MANWYQNIITITAETKEDLLDYVKAVAEEDGLGAVDGVDDYISALNEADEKATNKEDTLLLSNPPGRFMRIKPLQGDTSFSISVYTPGLGLLVSWAEKVLARFNGIAISGSNLNTMENIQFELSTIYDSARNVRTITGEYVPKEWELEENWIDIPEGAVEFVVPLDKPANGKIQQLEMPMTLRKIVLHDNIREIINLAGEDYSEQYNVEEVVLGKNAHATIGHQAFSQLPNLKRIVIPSGTKVEAEAFFGCKALEEVVIEGDIADFAPESFHHSNLEHMMAERYPDHFVLHKEIEWNPIKSEEPVNGTETEEVSNTHDDDLPF